jgi:hypothetical protein
MRVHFAPIGYHRSFVVPPGIHWSEGCFFLGSSSKIRRQVFRRIATMCPKNCYGTEREKLLRSPGVHFNFNGRQHPQFFHGLRVVMHYLSNACCVVSDAPLNCSYLRPGVHLVAVPREHMADAAADLLASGAWEGFGNRGQDYIKRNLRIEKTIIEQVMRWL